MKIFIKHPGKNPRQIVIPESDVLNVMQQLVGGYIETVTMWSDCTIICNEEGRWRNLPDNCEVCGINFVGNILFVGVSGEEFCDVPFSLDEMQQTFPGLWEEEE